MIEKRLHKREGMPDMYCRQIIDCRAFEEGDPYEKICFEPKMEGFQVKYKKRTFLNW